MKKDKKYTVSKYRGRYSIEFKHKICREFINGNYTKTELQDKYRIKGKSRLLSWLRELGYMEYVCEKNRSIMKSHITKRVKTSDQSPEYIKKLEEALKDVELKAEAYCKMIEIAEREYKIKIRKKLNTK